MLCFAITAEPLRTARQVIWYGSQLYRCTCDPHFVPVPGAKSDTDKPTAAIWQDRSDDSILCLENWSWSSQAQSFLVPSPAGLMNKFYFLSLQRPPLCFGYRFRGPGSIPGATRCFWKVVGLERGPISLVSTTEELLEGKSSGSGLENRGYGRRGSATLTTRHPYIRKKLALTSPTSGGRSVGIVRSRTRATKFVCFSYGSLQILFMPIQYNAV
jgi:hypothetical protein